MPHLVLPAKDVPRLETERLLLRAHGLGDFDDLVAMWGDAEVNRYIGAGTTRNAGWDRLLKYAGHWALLGFGYWAVEDKASGRFVGDVGLADYKREIEPSIEGQPECGWVLAPWCYGRGYATEAVRAVLAWAAESIPGQKVVCLVNPENLASLCVAQKCGFEEFGRTTFHGDPTVMLCR